MGGSQNPVKQTFTKTKGYVVGEGSGGGRDQSNLCTRLYMRSQQSIGGGWTLGTVTGREAVEVAVSTSVGKGMDDSDEHM